MQRGVDYAGITRYFDQNSYAAHDYKEFKNLKDVTAGDIIYLRRKGRREKYSVSGSEIVHEREYDKIRTKPGEIILQTCTDHPRHRLIVTATSSPRSHGN